MFEQLRLAAVKAFFAEDCKTLMLHPSQAEDILVVQAQDWIRLAKRLTRR